MDRTDRGPHVAASTASAVPSREGLVLLIVLSRLLLMALPFAVYFVWRRLAQRSGREMGATPWGWLTAAGLLLIGLSLMATVAFRPDNRGATYVPAEAQPGGRVTPGGFDRSRPLPPASEASPNTAP